VLADDNRDMLEYLHRLLAREFAVTVASDGEQALKEALSNPPDLVLTDVMMPRMDGFGLIRALRANPKTASIPIVMLSAKVGEEAEVEGLEAGADDYLIKPFSAVELLARVNAQVKMHRLRMDMTQKEQELRLKAEDAEQRYKSILESISEACIFVDRDWRISYANTQAARVFSQDIGAELGRNLWEAVPDLANSPLGDALCQAMDGTQTVRVEDNYAPVGRWLHVNAYPSPGGLSLFVMDITDRKTQEKQLLISEKLAATGRLAATIAHEINNPLEAVFNLIYLARTSRTDIEKIRGYLATAEREITRVSHIARHTLGFYRDSSQRDPCNESTTSFPPALLSSELLWAQSIGVWSSKLIYICCKIHPNKETTCPLRRKPLPDRSAESLLPQRRALNSGSPSIPNSPRAISASFLLCSKSAERTPSRNTSS
jgi:PAS domain S-box-containing protein